MSIFDSPEMAKAMEALEHADYSAAAPLLLKLAADSNPRAQCNLAFLYSIGRGVELDGQKAVDLYRAVAERNIKEGNLSAVACNNLATIYSTSLPGIRSDAEKAERYLKRARELGFEM